MAKLTEKHIRDKGFSSSFTSDPQDFDASKKYVLGNITIYQPNENIDDFIICPDGQEVINLKTVKEFKILLLSLTT